MDDRRFDALTRALARGSSRRAALKGLFGGLVGGAALATRLDGAGAQGCESDTQCSNGFHCCSGTCRQCCTAEDCPNEREDECGVAFCDDGLCSEVSACTGAEGPRCCNSGTPDHYCAFCCGDSDCPSCQSCIAGTCQEDECCGDSDCVSVCGECVEGTCVTRCTGEEYCCAFANDCRAPGECCTDDECPCGGACIDGACLPDPPCPEGQECCGDTCSPIGTCCQELGETCDNSGMSCCPDLTCCETPGGSWCGECCTNADCPGDCQVCVEGTCGPACGRGQECCDDECVALGTCCRESGETCAVTDGPGTQGNCCDDLLCCPEGDGGYCAECCNDDDCGDCAYCNQGVCYGECSQSQECCNDECVPLGQCVHICIPEAQPCAGSQLDCCVGLKCCIAGEASFCTECCEDSDCGDCEICDSGVCAPKSDCCKREGSICGVTPTDDSAQLDCCDGLVCCDNLYYGASVCAECCVDHDCPHGDHCHEGECKRPHVCTHDAQCPEGTCCCDDGCCSGECCPHPHPHPHPKPTPPETVTTLPATGAGPNDERNNLLGVAALGAAAALFAAKTLRDGQESSEEPVEN